MTNDQAFDILENALRELPKGSGWREQAHQALLHLERNRTSSRVSMGPLDALDAIGKQIRAVSTIHGEIVTPIGRGDMEYKLKAQLADETIFPLPIEWDEVVSPTRCSESRAILSGVFLTEEQLKQYWSVLAYGE